MEASRGATPNLEVLRALLAGDNVGLAEALAGATRQQLEVTYPLSPYHAAAFWGDRESVRLLHAAGVPAAAATALCHGAAVADLFQLEGDAAQQVSEFHCTPLAGAVWRGDVALIDALLAVGAAVDQPSPQLPGALARRVGPWDTEHQPATPLDIAACCSAEFGEQHTVELLEQLLAAGADVTRTSQRSLFSCSRGPALLLLEHLQRASEEGQLQLSAEDELSWSPLVETAAKCDSVPALEHFLGRVLQLPVLGRTLEVSLPRFLLRSAAKHGSLSMLRLAAQGAAQLAAGDAVEEGSLAQLLGPQFAACLPELLESAAQSGQAPTVCLLLDLGAVPTTAAACKAVETGAAASLRALLSRGLLGFPRALRQPLLLPSNPRSMAYPCPILATLQTRLKRAMFTLRGVEAILYFKQNADAVHPWDAKLLPGLEALLDAGYRPRTFQDVMVRFESAGEPVLRKQFDPLDPNDGDAGLDVQALRLLMLAIEHPDWSPAMHRRFPRSFRAAASALLLVAHRGGTRAGAPATEGAAGLEQQVPADGAAAGLASLPHELLLRIISLAAYPLSAWAPLDAAATQAVIDANGWGQLPS